MYAFNAVQFVLLFAALPWGLHWLKTSDFPSPVIWIGYVLMLGMGIFLIVATTRQLYDIDCEIRGIPRR